MARSRSKGGAHCCIHKINTHTHTLLNVILQFVWWLNEKLRASHCPSFSAFSAWVQQLTNFERLVTLGPESDDRLERNRRVAWAVNVNSHLVRRSILI